MLIDTHCHLNFDAFKKDYHQVIQRSLEKGMKMILVGSQLGTSQRAVELAHQFNDVYAAVGLHPIHIQDEEYKEEYETMAEDSKVVAIGEVGLDYYRLWADSEEEEREIKNQQKELLLKFLTIAVKVGKPAILHCRDAYEDMLATLNSFEELDRLKAVVHCFIGSKEIGRKFLALGLMVSFTGIITFTDDQQLLDFIRETDIERIMIETDAPYLSPAPHRSKRCEPIYVEEVAKKIAEIKEMTTEEVIQKTGENAINFFNLH
jgi:TatD DNase family protein